MRPAVPGSRFLGAAGQQDEENFEESEQHEDDLHPGEDVELRPQPDGEGEEGEGAGPVDDVEQPDDSEEEGTAGL